MRRFRAFCAFAFRAGSARIVLRGFRARRRIQFFYYYYYYYLLLLLLKVLIIRAGSARLRFARVPRVCFSRGFRACCSARVPRASSHSNFLLLLLLLLLLDILIVRAGSARMCFARVPRVMRVCFWRGFRACCSARVPRASSHSNFLFLTTTTTPTTTTTRHINSTRGFCAYVFRAGSARYARLLLARVPRVLFCAGSARVVAFKFLISYYYYS